MTATLRPLGTTGSTHRFERRAMGSALRFVVVGTDEIAARRAWQAVDAEFEAAEQAMSRHRETSDLTRANRAAARTTDLARWVDVDLRLRHALVTSDRARRQTDGRFDPRVLSDLERLGSVGVPQVAPGALAYGPRLPPDPESGWLAVDARRPQIRLGTPVDLGGIGKGLALRWAWRAARRHIGPNVGALIDAGGDIVVGGPSTDGGAWSVGLEDPCGEAEHVAVIAVADGAVATSSVVVNRWRAPDGRVVHHLIDPATGEPGGAGLLAVTVAGPDPAWAEVWSKTLFLAGRTGIVSLARSRGLAAWWVTWEGDLEMTAAARLLTTWELARRRDGTMQREG